MAAEDKLTLYIHPMSGYSQKALLVVNYLKLNFTPKTVDIFVGEQLEPWFVKINPKAQVPVLEVNGQVIVDSARIIEFLDRKYNDPNHALLPDESTPLGQEVRKTADDLNSISMPLITFGSLRFRNLTKSPLISDKNAKERLGFPNIMRELLKKMMSDHPEHKAVYEDKLKLINGLENLIASETSLKNELDKVEQVLGRVDSIIKEKSKKWLFTDYVTIADVGLLLLIHRLRVVGFWHRVFHEDFSKNKNLLKYFDRASNEEFFKLSFQA